MFVAVALVGFVFGFLAATVVATRSRKLRTDISSLLSRLHLISNDVGKGFEEDFRPQEASVTTSDEKARWSSSELLTKKQVETRFEPSSWQFLAYEDFKTTILAKQAGVKKFPCVYATMGYRDDEHRYIFLETNNPAEPRNIRRIAPALETYLDTAKQIGPNTSLVIIGAPSEKAKSVDAYNDTFWNMLRGLRMTDPKPWPEEVPKLVESTKWTFCYNGEPVFPIMLTPAHTQRWSRHMSVPIIALQPKWVLDDLLSTPEKRCEATGKVRKLLREFDQVDISPDLTSYGHPGTSEARQLCLLDENQTVKCPYDNFDT